MPQQPGKKPPKNMGDPTQNDIFQHHGPVKDYPSSQPNPVFRLGNSVKPVLNQIIHRRDTSIESSITGVASVKIHLPHPLPATTLFCNKYEMYFLLMNALLMTKVIPWRYDESNAMIRTGTALKQATIIARQQVDWQVVPARPVFHNLRIDAETFGRLDATRAF